MVSIQLKFILHAPPSIRTIQLLGSWDNYVQRLPMSNGNNRGTWLAVSQFTTTVLQPGARYRYYYIIDGEEISQDTDVHFFDIPDKIPQSSPYNISGNISATLATDLRPRASSLEIQHPQPLKPSLYILKQLYLAVSDLECDLYHQNCGISAYRSDESDHQGTSPSLNGMSRYSGSSSSTLPFSQPLAVEKSTQCYCHRYGVTRSGDRVKIDCGSSRCGYTEIEDTDCSESEDDRDKYGRTHNLKDTRRWGMVFI